LDALSHANAAKRFISHENHSHAARGTNTVYLLSVRVSKIPRLANILYTHMQGRKKEEKTRRKEREVVLQAVFLPMEE
jgi:hypothetical protein